MSKRILKIARKLVDKLETLHSFGFMHGDVNEHNVVFRNVVSFLDDIDVDTADIALTGFETAIRFAHDLRTPVRRTAFNNCHPLCLSKWNLMHERQGPRDDIFHVLRIVAHYLSRGRFTAGVTAMVERNLDAAGLTADGSSASDRVQHDVVRHVFSEQPMFEYSIAVGSGAMIGISAAPALVKSIRARLETLADHVRSYAHPDHKPMYAEIKRALDDIISAL